MEVDKVGVHRTHCCLIHGCKYDDEDCPVVSGEVEQEYSCEYCISEYNPFPSSVWMKKKDEGFWNFYLGKNIYVATLQHADDKWLAGIVNGDEEPYRKFDTRWKAMKYLEEQLSPPENEY